MMNWLRSVVALCLVVVLTFPVWTGRGMAETAVGSNVDGRVIVALKVDDTAAQELLPEGWSVLTLPKGPFAGSNLLTVFIDRRLVVDPEGKPLEPSQGYAVALLAYGTNPQAEGARVFVTRVYETPPIANSYGNSIAAEFRHELTRGTDADRARYHRETWKVLPETGGQIEFMLDYQMGQPTWWESEVRPYSAADPEFSRLYLYEQVGDLALSSALGKELKGEISLKVDLPELERVFDGQQAVMGAMVVPVYIRDVYLP